jgi:hypothetical protein
MFFRIGLGIGLALSASAVLAQDSSNPQARDAINLFGNLCGKIIAGLDMPPDDGRYRIVQVDAKSAAEAVPSLDGAALWSISAPGSNTRMLHYVTNRGICGVEVAEADAGAIDVDVAAFVHGLASRWGTAELLTKDETDDGSHMRIWTLHGPDQDIVVGLTTFQGRKEPEHILTMARAMPATDTPSTSGRAEQDPPVPQSPGTPGTP